MITRKNKIKVKEFDDSVALEVQNKNDLYKDAIFFDLEHYVYKKPICVGVFGCCYFKEEDNSLEVIQYMIESKAEAKNILLLAKKYFECISAQGKKYIVTFSGNNDFTVIHYLFKKYDIEYDINEHFYHIDLQKEYEKIKKQGIGLKALEKLFGIERDGELISGSNLAKTFSKVMKDPEYFNRMPIEKKDKILLYNEQDVVNLFYIYTKWLNGMNKTEEEV